MQFFSTMLFVLSASTDNFVVGLCYGIKKINITLPINIIIALISSIGTILSMELGKLIINFIPQALTNAIGGLILIIIGLWAILSEFNSSSKKSTSNKGNNFLELEDILSNPESADKDTSGNIEMKESFSLAVALSLNNMGLGIGASIAGLNIILTSVSTFFISLISISLGFTIGSKYLSKRLGKYAALVSGIIIIALGIYEILI